MLRWISILFIAFIILLSAFYWWPRIPPSSSNSGQTEMKKTEEIRGAIDIGSGTTNLKVAKVDPQTNKIISIIYQQTIPVSYQKQLEQSKNNEFSQDIMNEGIKSIQLLKNAAADHHAKKVVAIATAAFRQAANGQTFADAIEKSTGVKVRVIDQDEEGILAFRGAIALTPVQPQNAIVWDIGGGSMQLTTLSDSGTYLIEHGKLASIPFKNAIIQQIEKKDLKEVSSPNPMNEAEMESAIEFAKQKAQETDPFIITKLASPNAQVLAVGNLFNLGVRSMFDKETITQAELAHSLNGLVGKADDQIPGDVIPEVAVSNPLLVLGYMKGLNIHEIHFVRVNNADGALTYPVYWDVS
jgi:exopolyphosphatase/guanosine-5'-triphosphate,3'-diphosphate pyrophosphatase